MALVCHTPSTRCVAAAGCASSPARKLNCHLNIFSQYLRGISTLGTSCRRVPGAPSFSKFVQSCNSSRDGVECLNGSRESPDLVFTLADDGSNQCRDLHSRRGLFVGTALVLSAVGSRPSIAAESSAAPGSPSPPSLSGPQATGEVRKGAEATGAAPKEPPQVDTTITGRVYLDFSLCPTATRLDRTLGNTSLICEDGETLGRVVIGLYGKQVPQTVANFVAMVTGKAGSTYQGSIIHKILPGQFIQGGKQGARDKGEVPSPSNLERNQETISGKAFKLRHNRPGTVSLCLGENDDEDMIKSGADYRNVEFLITTGPGPAPQLDNGNIVFGTVLEGMDVISQITTVPTYKPNERIRQFNEIAQLLGDDRAANARSIWDRPLKSVVISACGALDVAKPYIPPALP